MDFPCDIYYINNNKPCILQSAKKLNKIDILMLEKAELEGHSLFIRNEDIIKFSPLLKHDIFEDPNAVFNVKFDDIKEHTTALISNCFQTQHVDKVTCEAVSFDIKDTVITFDAANILKSISIANDVDQYLYSHSTNVAFLNGLMGKWLNFDNDQIQKLVKIGLLHDIGKSKIPEKILNKPGPLTEQEYEIVKLHPIYSYQMLLEMGENDPELLFAVKSHHEKMNGTGYPDRLISSEIPSYARITTISDIYDAMVSKRVYKPQNSPFEVLAEFAQGRFSNLDTMLVNKFLSNMPTELIGKDFVMSDGRIGTVMYVNPNNYEFPIIKIDDKIIKTNEEYKCVSLK